MQSTGRKKLPCSRSPSQGVQDHLSWEPVAHLLLDRKMHCPTLDYSRGVAMLDYCSKIKQESHGNLIVSKQHGLGRELDLPI